VAKKNKKMKTEPRRYSSSWIWIWLAFIVVYSLVSSSGIFDSSTNYDTFLNRIQSEEIKRVVLGPDKVMAELAQDGEWVSTYRVDDEQLIPLLKEKKIPFRGSPPPPNWGIWLAWLLPLFLIFFVMRNLSSRMGSPFFGVGQSKAKVYMQKEVKVGFKDVAGVDEAKAELQELVNFLKDQKKYSRLGGKIPKGILLVGPPGTGKTLMARAVAGEASVPFFSINGSEFVELFVGVGALRVRDLFEQARKQAPCIIFIDELDALGKARSLNAMGGANDEKEQTLNQLLAELDGFDSSSGVVLLAATNRPEVLDPALLRAGRFDRQILMDNPDRMGRLAILHIHTQSVKVDPEVDLEVVASMTPGFSGADLANLVNEAALMATRRDGDAVTLQDFELALERIVAGLERKQKLINPEEKKRVAYHELGHATAALALQTDSCVQKISIIPRGIGALGYTLQRPTQDRYLMTRNELLQKITVLLGGRASEEIYFDDLSTGASDDLGQASSIAESIVTQYGLGKTLGLLTDDISSTFLSPKGDYYNSGRHFSEVTQQGIDEEIRGLLDECYAQAAELLRANDDFIQKTVAELLEKESLSADEIAHLWERWGVGKSAEP
jgi:cell division protease FtsH